MMTTTLLYVRHAEVFNPENVLYGRLPGWHLSDNGRYFARKLADILASSSLAAIYTSPLLRARQTARILARHHTDVAIHARKALIEVGSPSWEGVRYADIPVGKTVYELRRQDGDETIEDVWQRMKQFCDMLRQQHDGQTVLCVSHGDPIKILTAGLRGQPLSVEIARQPDPARCSVTRIDWFEDHDTPTINYTDYFHQERWEKVADLAELTLGINLIRRDRRTILIHRVDETTVFATAAHCPHMRTLLSDGCLSSVTLTCPLHGAQYNVQSGEMTRAPILLEPLTAAHCQINTPLTPVEASHLQTFTVKVENGSVFLRIH
jgi:broad specificity phosphatase PhoE